MTINSTSNEEFPVKILEDQLKKSVLHLLYDKVVFLGDCVKVK